MATGRTFGATVHVTKSKKRSPNNRHHHNRFTALSPGPPGSAVVSEENFWTLWCKGRLTEADTPTIQLGARLTSAHLHQPLPFFYRPYALPAAQPTVSKHWRQLAHSDEGEDARVLLNGVTCTVSVPQKKRSHKAMQNENDFHTVADGSSMDRAHSSDSMVHDRSVSVLPL